MELIVALFGILVQAVFSGSETSLVRSNWIRIATWANENRRGPARARKLLDRRELALITTLVGASLLTIAVATVAERFFVHAIGRGGTVVSILVVSSVTLLLGQYLPKAVAQAHPEAWLSLFAPLLQLVEIVFYPLTWLLGRISGSPVGGKTEFTVARRDVVFALRERARFDAGGSRLSGIASRLLDFPKLTVAETMTPSSRVVMVPEDITEPALEQIIRQHSFTRLPVYRSRRNNIVGVIHVRDLLLLSRRTMRKPFFVAQHARAIDVMNQMKDQGEHIAIVHDQNHHCIGMVTLEDLLEELVGEIRSEE